MNTEKGLVRKRKREMEKAKSDLRAKQLQSLTLKQFKVGVITMGMHNFTIMATDEQSAVNKVMSGKGGRKAGKEGPLPFAFRVQDMAIIQPPVTLEQVMKEIGNNKHNTSPPKTEPAPTIVVPGK